MDTVSQRYYEKLLNSEYVPQIVREKHERLMAYLRMIGGYSRPEVETQAIILMMIDPKKIREQIASMEEGAAVLAEKREREQKERIDKMDADRALTETTAMPLSNK